tara:strand:+ start:9626 stop:10114 length:489 start_codon:yes stop_codon:yes gene_type:complete
MKKIEWCKTKSRGIKKIDPNDNLSEEYLENAEESLEVLRSIHKTKSKMWLATTKYYIKYFAVYSIFMKIGIKCEIHDCTIALIENLENGNIFEVGTAKTLEKDKQLRIDNQYYLKNKEVNINFDELAGFMLFIREALENLDEDRIEEIRETIFPSKKDTEKQ